MKNILEEYGTVTVLLVLKKHGRLTTRKLLDNVNISGEAALKAVNKLIESGLIEEEREEKFPRRRFLKLTEKGELVAKKLDEIVKILES